MDTIKKCPLERTILTRSVISYYVKPTNCDEDERDLSRGIKRPDFMDTQNPAPTIGDHGFINN